MSATGRSERGGEGVDFFETPEWITRAVLHHLPNYLTRDIIVDAGCGTGAITAVIANFFAKEYTTVGIDLLLRPEFFERCSNTALYVADFLTERTKIDWDNVAMVVMNPPYSLAQEFIERALELTKGQVPVVALLRLGFAGGQARAKWFRQMRPSILISPRRPSFTPDGATDASEYAWFLFDRKGEVDWLETEREKGEET